MSSNPNSLKTSEQIWRSHKTYQPSPKEQLVNSVNIPLPEIQRISPSVFVKV